MNGEYTCSRVIYSYGDLMLTSYARLPTVERNGDFLNLKGGSVTMHLKILSKNKKALAAYAINMDNAYDVVNWLNEALQWFYLDQYNDMFYRGEDNEWVFNMAYKELHKDTGRDTPTDPLMRIYPNTVKRTPYSDPEPGVIIIINRTEYSCTLPLVAARQLLSTMTAFSFQEEMVLMTNSILLHAIRAPRTQLESKPKNIWEK